MRDKSCMDETIEQRMDWTTGKGRPKKRIYASSDGSIGNEKLLGDEDNDNQ